MKTALLLLPLAALMLSSKSQAAPKITEIRLADLPGFIAPPVRNNTFIFRSNGTFDWLEGITTKPIKHHYSLVSGDFEKLTKVLEAHHFSTMKPIYDRLKPTDGVFTDGPSVIVSVSSGKEKKSVEDYAEFGPPDLWEIEMVMRGLASRYIGLRGAFVRPAMPPTGQ